ncbi:MAG: hypothetical protein AMQ22_02188 [Candidatus Methanofastidiosum methylothiophilum]|jgi:hypothetical protein|uniref:RiboL-PSP-HEPN domain-containing protein n=1 Tax=Candidatus Methanofastidiosum methylothiophilum TaxID=1705564 RepID=A0A150IL83_9EURY|nr:MAG: hypothetical protein AMQ22_02188 [Candidatus Methanofastidiosum methylthiophilus]
MKFLTEYLNGKAENVDRILFEDLFRLVIVLAVAAMDNYFTQKFVDMLIPILKSKKPSKELVNFLEGSGVTTEMALTLISLKRPMLKIKKLVEIKLERYTTQNQKSIDCLFLMYGIKDFCTNIGKKSRKASLLKSISLLVERRNVIVHNGDINKYHKANSVNPDEIFPRLEMIPVFITNAESILNSYINNMRKKN